MLVRDKIVDIERINTQDVKKIENKSELLMETKLTILEKTDKIISNSILNTNESNATIIQETSDIIEILLANLKNQNINELDLVKMMEDKKRLCGSYNLGYIK